MTWKTWKNQIGCHSAWQQRQGSRSWGHTNGQQIMTRHSVNRNQNYRSFIWVRQYGSRASFVAEMEHPEGMEIICGWPLQWKGQDLDSGRGTHVTREDRHGHGCWGWTLNDCLWQCDGYFWLFQCFSLACLARTNKFPCSPNPVCYARHCTPFECPEVKFL